MNNIADRKPTKEEVDEALADPQKYLVLRDSDGLVDAIYTYASFRRPESSLRDDSWDNNNQY